MTVAMTSTVEVLIVDDQAPFRMVARTLVRRLDGWQVVGEAASGEEAVEAAAATRPGLVLMDINLPGISGIEATRRILAAAPETRVILLSTYADDDLPPDARTCGAKAYVRKDDLTLTLLRELQPTV
jgi:DNA-binding NarL/FixJ family response regulator